jgi:hypothetical protein
MRKVDVKDDAKVDAAAWVNLCYQAILCFKVAGRRRKNVGKNLAETGPFFWKPIETNEVSVRSPSDNMNGIHRKLPSQELSLFAVNVH